MSFVIYHDKFTFQNCLLCDLKYIFLEAVIFVKTKKKMLLDYLAMRIKRMNMKGIY